jgi:hypothetical protein
MKFRNCSIAGRPTVAEKASFCRREKNGKVSLEKQIFQLFSRLSDNLEIWRMLTDQYNSDLFCGLYTESWNREIDFSPELMAQISARGLTLRLDTYHVETRLILVEPNFSSLSSSLR